jgi:hypothetical protein
MQKPEPYGPGLLRLPTTLPLLVLIKIDHCKQIKL